jgi:hypothetical protein
MPGATLEDVIAAVNANTARVYTYSASGATIRPPNMPIALSGGILLERPSRFRVYAGTAVTGPEIDFGTNEELLWMWMRLSETPGVYVWRRDQFARSQAQQMMPIDPDWLPSALGLVEFEPHGQHQMRLLPDRRLEVVSAIPGPSGTLTRVCVVDPTRAWVLQQHLYDASGAPVVTALASGHRYYPEHQVSLPQRIEVQVPAAQWALAIDVGQVQLNGTLGDPGQLWRPPQIEGSPQMEMSAGSGGLAVGDPTTGNGSGAGVDATAGGQVMYVPKLQRIPSVATPERLRQPLYRTSHGP